MAVWYVKRSAFLVSLQQTGGPPSWRIHWDVWPSAAEAWKSKWIAPSWELPDPASLRVGLTTPKASFRKAVQILLFFFCVRLAENGRKHCACDILWRHCADWHFYSLDVFWMGFGILKDFTPWDPLIALHPKEPVPLAAGPLPGNLALRRPLFGTSKGCWFNA